MEDDENTERIVEAFDKKTELIAKEFILPKSILIEDLQELFGEPPEDLMYAAYEIKDKHVSFFEERAGIKFEFDKYDYFLGCYEVKRK